MSTAPAVTSGLERWLAPLVEDLPDLAVFDAHTHIGADSDGTVCEPEHLIATLDLLGARAVTFPLHVEGCYRRANDATLAAAAASGEHLVPFCRLDPHTDALSEGEHAIGGGARGIKLHPRAEGFTLPHPGVEDAFGLANEHRLPVLIHAGLGIDSLGADVLRLADDHPHATVILAHAAITDLAWMADALDSHRNILLDTAWWNPVDLLALFALMPPGRIIFGSDTPYGDPTLNAVITLRCALAVGLNGDQIRAVMGGQLERLLDGRPLLDLGPAPGSAGLERDVLLDRVTTYIAVVWGSALAGGSLEDPLALVRLALTVGRRDGRRGVCDAIAEALALPPIGPQGLAGLAIAATIAATPKVPIDPPA